VCSSDLSVVVLYSLTWFISRSYAATFRGLLWLASAAVVALVAHRVLGDRRVSRVRFGLFVVWMLCCALLYVMIDGVDVLIYRLSGVPGPFPLGALLLHGARLGGGTGLGIGLGYDIARIMGAGRDNARSPDRGSGTG
jgi:hypothetical protein